MRKLAKLLAYGLACLLILLVLKIAVSGASYSIHPVVMNIGEQTRNIRLVAHSTRRQCSDETGRIPGGKSLNFSSIRLSEPEFPLVIEIWSVPKGTLLERRTVPRGEFTTEVVFKVGS